MRFRGSLAARVALLTTLAVGFFVASVAAAAYVTVRHQLVASLDASLYERAATLADVDVDILSDGGTAAWLLGAADIHYAVLSADRGRVIAQDGRGDDRIELGRAELDVARGMLDRSARTATSSGDRYRVVAVPGPVDGTAMILAQSLEPTQDALKQLGFLLALAGLAGVVAAAFAGWAVAQQGLRPVRRLSNAVEEIARTQKLDPIPVEGTDDEVATLAMTFNRMLAALSASQERQRRLVADAGHELRTPLTSLRTNLDLLIQADARGGLSEAARAELMGDVLFQIDELTTLIGDLTELARDEPIPSQLEPVDVADVVEHALARVRRRAGGLQLDVHVEPWRVTGEAAALERAVTNLLDNAVKWSPPGGTVTVRLERGVLYVADQGPGIAEEDLPHVFERFYRSRESRTMPGSGLGLSIVRAITERHGGMVRAGAAEGGGAAFWLWLPPLEEAATEPVTDTAGSEAKS
ncbi:sensor histidine kinase [Nocardioides caldifontis]|uniref:sensor histidine kinase n=1 Tax=Nocardioides caldifontis TaxID=2588938 RepID=UPI0011DF9D82|nr:HAMP domain-containing sensor histidine kinase [Nocardioides caldifontis]